MNPPEIILGVDPGTYHLGVGLVLKKGPKIHFLHTDTYSPRRNLDLSDRLHFLQSKLIDLFHEWQPTTVALERLIFAKNVQSAFQLGMARGIAFSVALLNRALVFEYAPTEVKLSVAGYGRADKAQVKKMVEMSLNQKIDHGPDATDALALALCHAFKGRGLAL